MIASKTRPSPIIMPFAIICSSVLSITFVFIVDDLLMWLGWRFMQRSIANYAAYALLALIIPAALTWRMIMTHDEIDHMDFVGLLFGCVLGGLLLALYTIFPPAGFVTLLIFVALGVIVFVFVPRPNWVMIFTSMTLAFAAMSILISGWAYAHQQPISEDRFKGHVYHYVHDVSEIDKGVDVYILYDCNTLGLFCRIVDYVAVESE